MSNHSSPKASSSEIAAMAGKIDTLTEMMLGLHNRQEQMHEATQLQFAETNAKIAASRANSRSVSPRSLAAAMNKLSQEKSGVVPSYSFGASEPASVSKNLAVQTKPAHNNNAAKPSSNVTTREETKKKSASEESDASFVFGNFSDNFLTGRDVSESDSESEAVDNPFVSKDPNRRKSHLAKTAEEGMKASQPIQWTKTLPDCTAYLEKCTPAAVATFIKDITKYSENFHHQPVLSRLIHDDVVDIMQSYQPDVVKKLGKITAADLLHLLEGILAPRSKELFLKALRENVEFAHCVGFILSPQYYSAFWTKLRNYEGRFSRVYDVLSARALTENIPKQKDVIKVFLEKIPYDYGKSVGLQLDKVPGESLKTYFHRFRLFLTSDLLKAQSALEAFSRFSGTEVNVAQAAAAPVTSVTPTPTGILRRPGVLANIQMRSREQCDQDQDLSHDSQTVDEDDYEDCLMRMMG
eukprot:gene20042-22779_t